MTRVTETPTFEAGQMVELTQESGWRGNRPALFKVEHCRLAGTSGWGYLTGYLPGHGSTSTFFLDLRAVLPTEVH
jgi:hypothetical protein